MRIAQIAPLFESVPPKLYGGTERVVDNLTRGLLAEGHEVTVFCSGDSKVPGEIHAVHPESLRLSTQKILDPVAYQFKALAAVAERAHEFDVIHNHYDYLLLALERMCSTPLVTTMHGRMDLPDLPIALEGYRDSALVSISNAQRRPLTRMNWVKTIQHALNASEFRFYEKPGRYLAFLGRFSPEKGAHLAIEIALKSGIPLKMAAKIDEPDREYFEKILRPKIDGKFIEYVGEISEPEKSDFLGNALALAFPINWPEPFGLVMIEAMACGTPILARPVGSVPEVVTEGITGFIRESVNELAALVVTQIPRLNRRRIRSHVENRYSIERMTQEYLDVYRNLGKSREGAISEIKRFAHHRRNFLHSVNGSADRDTKGIA
ncbi:MAG: glycosyltransferase family 4 protein [Bdellovibrionota bacterium]